MISIDFIHCFYREQKTIDLENRARYKALHERWVVLDKTVHLPDEEPSSDPLEYVFSSEGEDPDEDQNNESRPHQGRYMYMLFRPFILKGRKTLRK